ncbi:C39 family peptidase [Hamadaea tsunoensis]|uniref:C39 family peptidase n=1 Tax=Hamadaea tsunoensis TaxID=53368 RepID=UPI000427E4B0|nr:C39 family peptidase [Hamadaea tsunoensis]
MKDRSVLPEAIVPPAADPAAPRDIVLRRWTPGFTLPPGHDTASWLTEVALDFPATEIVASWTATTPGPSWIEVETRGTTTAGTTTRWYALGRWAATDEHVRRTTVAGQADADGRVNADVFAAAPGREWVSCELRITLHRPAGSTAGPVLRSAAVMASRLPGPDAPCPAVEPAGPIGIVLDVPAYSQNIHKGEYPEYDDGGESWCSPTSTTMVMDFWGRLPEPAEYAWVDPAYPDPFVCHAARGTFDHAYNGCGNWPFNVAYAGRYGLDGFVTRLRSLDEAARFIAAGVPLILSASFEKGEVPGLDYSTRGHLVVLAGFAEDGRPVLNDPASTGNTDVRKPVGRAEFERAWLRGSRGVAYVITPPGHPLPAAPEQANW